MTDQVLIDRSQGVLTLTLNRPEKKNALNDGMYAALGAAIEGADDDRSIGCILIQANGDMFCSGRDVSELGAAPAAGASASTQPPRFGSPLVHALARSGKPVVAAVNGRAVGVGATMLLHCDLVYLADDASLTTPFANLALTPEAASSLLLTARIGHARAFSMFVLGETVDAPTALAWGLANAVVSPAELHARARAAAVAVAAKPPGAVAATKRLMRDVEAITARIQEEGVHFTAQLRSAESKEAMAAFREKRKPDFSPSALGVS
ncbi:enoyl-CoA hydratase-related protein [uncultured Phenylobacterium sp.]|uniref:enoyl-CoA hydratase-related protein n=1 Tax=uncultured Phenylobacterium sp. TaxID=349273 RepID=UPI0025DD82D8|nr:enoyl-CoA hydratase-related protein [uncultured Phenylobacterium sp.]